MKIIEKIKKGLNKFWNETLGQDYTDAELAGLSINSSNPTEVILAESLADIDSRNGKNKGGNESGIKGIKLTKNQLKPRQTVMNKTREKSDKEMSK